MSRGRGQRPHRVTAPSEGSWVDDVDVTSSCRAQSRFAFLGAEAGDVKDLMQATLALSLSMVWWTPLCR